MRQVCQRCGKALCFTTNFRKLQPIVYMHVIIIIMNPAKPLMKNITNSYPDTVFTLLVGTSRQKIRYHCKYSPKTLS